MTVSALTVMSASVFGVPDLSGIAGAAVCLVAGLAAMVWMFVRAGREGGFRSNREQLADVAAADRRLAKNSRRHPGQIPDHLTPLAARYARRQADSNDRTGWLSVALILVNGPSLSTAHGVWLAAAFLCLGIFVITGFAGDYLGVRWGQTEAVMLERAQARHHGQQVTRDALGS